MDRLKANFHNALALRASIVQIGLALPGINGEYHLPELGSLKPLKTQELERDIKTSYKNWSQMTRSQPRGRRYKTSWKL